MNPSRLIASLVLVGMIAAALPGCVLAPFVDSFKKSGMMESDRQQLLPIALSKYHQSLTFADPGDIMTLVDDEMKPRLRAIMSKRKGVERIVETNIEAVTYSNNSYEAAVDVTSKYFKVPFYIVTERKERETWKFSLTNGWLLSAVGETPALN